MGYTTCHPAHGLGTFSLEEALFELRRSDRRRYADDAGRLAVRVEERRPRQRDGNGGPILTPHADLTRPSLARHHLLRGFGSLLG